MYALEDILVLEVGHQVAAPYCSLLLADLGAEVWKIEKPGQGDGTRRWNPSKPGGAFYALNRNKKSISLDLKQGKDVFLSMVKKADVIVENLAPGTMERYGLDYATVSSINPRIIYCSVSGYGSDGPYSKLPGWDPVIEALSGYMSMIGHQGEPFSRAPSSTFDQSTGMLAALGILSALRSRDKTGKGSKVEVSLLDTIISILGYMITDYSMTGITPKRQGSEMDHRAPYGVFRTRTQPIYLAVALDEDWDRFCQALGATGLFSDERFQTLVGRVKNKQQLNAIVEELFSKMDCQEIVQLLVKFDIPCAPVNTIPDALQDPHIKSRKLVVDLAVTPEQKVKVANTPFRLSPEGTKAFSRSPNLGEQTDLILEKCGYDKKEITNLRTRGIL